MLGKIQIVDHQERGTRQEVSQTRRHPQNDDTEEKDVTDRAYHKTRCHDKAIRTHNSK